MIQSTTEIQKIAEQFAPIVYHSNDEPNLPTNVDWFLSRTSLWFCDAICNPILNEKVLDSPSQALLVKQTYEPSCGFPNAVNSWGTRSMKKQRSFYLSDLSTIDRQGSLNPTDWYTYFHVYDNSDNGITIQYWRFHAYNSGKKVIGVELGFHGGDWEGIFVVLNKDLNPIKALLMGHTIIEEVPWNLIQLEGTHPIVYSEKGGHSTLTTGSQSGIRQETWGTENDAKVVWPGKSTFKAGRLINIGEKIAPMNDQFFIQYSGLWGTPSSFPDKNNILYFISSGYWGPAYNETAMGKDGFITAWGAETIEPNKQVNGIKEFFSTDLSR
jgi:hypothetical protein